MLPVEYGSKNPLFPVLPKDIYNNPSWGTFQERETTPEEIEEWARKTNDRANIGWAMGRHINRVLFDVDTRHGGLESWQRLTRGEAIDTFMVGTHDAGFHAYFTHPGYPFELEGTWPGIDVRSDGTYGVGAGSLHPSGVTYEPLNNLDVAALPPCIADLVRPTRDKSIRVHRPLNPALSLQQVLEVFEKCDRKRDQYETRSGYDAGYDYAVVRTLANKGCSPALMLEGFDLTTRKTRYQQRAHRRGVEKARHELLAMYDYAITAPDTREYEAVGDTARFIRQFIMEQKWEGIAARSDQGVLLTHVNQFEDVRVAPWDLSVRSASEVAKVSKDTVSNAHRRLQENGWLKRYPKPYRSQCLSDAFEFGERLTDRLKGQNRGTIALSSFSSEGHRPHLSGAVSSVEKEKSENKTGKNLVGSSLIKPEKCPICQFSKKSSSEKVLSNNSNICICPTVQLFQHRAFTPGQTPTFGVFESKALGKSAERLWLALHHHEALKPAQLAIAAQVHKSTVGRTLPRLLKHGIVFCFDKKIRLNPDCDFEALGKRLGTIYLDQQRKNTHEIEREQQQRRGRRTQLEIETMKRRVKAKKARARKYAKSRRKQQGTASLVSPETPNSRHVDCAGT